MKTWHSVVAAAIALIAARDIQAYPTKPVRVIVPFAPGGGADIAARLVSTKFTERYGQPFIIDNRGGGGGIIGMELTAKAPADGYTIMVTGSFSGSAAVHRPAFDPINSIVQIAELGYAPFVLSVHPSLLVNSTNQLVALAKSKPDQLTYASTGVGGLTHLATELFSSMAGIKIVHVPYKSTGAAMVDLLSGRCQLIVGSMPPMLPYLMSGKLRPLAVTTEKRWYALPSVPTLAETLPGYEVKVAFGVMAPRGISRAIVLELNRGVNSMLDDQETKKTLEVLGLAPSGGTPEQFTIFTRTDYQRWVRVVEQTGIKVQ